jgi:hypothetical protein
MPVTLTDEQAKNWASTLRTMANTLDPPAATPTPAPIPPATNYPNFQLIYDEQFTKDCPEGQFLTTYGDRFFVYPNGWKDTSKKGNYNPGIISVNAGVMNMRMRTINGVPQVSAPEPKINGSRRTATSSTAATRHGSGRTPRTATSSHGCCGRSRACGHAMARSTFLRVILSALSARSCIARTAPRAAIRMATSPPPSSLTGTPRSSSGSPTAAASSSTAP